MILGIEFKRTHINHKCYFRVAPVIVATPTQRLYLGSLLVVILFVISIMLLEGAQQ